MRLTRFAFGFLLMLYLPLGCNFGAKKAVKDMERVDTYLGVVMAEKVFNAAGPGQDAVLLLPGGRDNFLFRPVRAWRDGFSKRWKELGGGEVHVAVEMMGDGKISLGPCLDAASSARAVVSFVDPLVLDAAALADRDDLAFGVLAEPTPALKALWDQGVVDVAIMNRVAPAPDTAEQGDARSRFELRYQVFDASNADAFEIVPY